MMPDGNTAALNDYEAKQAEADRTWAALEPQARQDVRDAWRENVSIGDVIDTLASLSAADTAEFESACRRNHSADVGDMLTTFLDRAADYFPDTKGGQEAVAERVWELDQEARDL